jgi:hypothetical protein
MSAPSTATLPPPHAPGERFHCRIDVEDICLSVEGDANSTTTALFWEEARVACSFNGVTQRTRWMALQPAMDEVKKELQTVADSSDGAAAQTGGLLALPFSAFSNLSYEVEFTAAAATDDPSVTAVATVKPKRFHTMTFVVETQNLHRVYSASGGQTGDRAPTSGNMEVISASLNKKAAKVSAWTRNVFAKLSGSSDKKGGHAAHNDDHHQQQQRNEAAIASLSDHVANPQPPPASTTMTTAAAAVALGDTTVREGTYLTMVKSIDASEAYNRLGGRQCYCLVVKPELHKLPASGVGIPITLSFTIVAHYGCTASVPRNFHNFAVVIDQFVLDYSEAATALPPDPKEEGGQPRLITGYAFGFTANTAAHPNGLEFASKVMPVTSNPVPGTAHAGEGGGEAALRVIDFERLHKQPDERQRTAEDYKNLPTSCVVVSGSTGSQPANQPRLGNRVVCVSRFKTSPDGLCKPSFKCQFELSLVRLYGSGGGRGVGGVREAASPIDLAALLNQETMQQRIRTVKFQLGEVMYLRLRLFCFDEPAVLRAPLLMPYDYHDSNVDFCASPPSRPAQQQQQRVGPADAAKNHNAEAAAAAATGTTLQVPPSSNKTATPPAGFPAASFETASSTSSSSSSSSSSSPFPAPVEGGQRSASGSDASTPRAVVQPDPTAPFFTLEPQEGAQNFLFGQEVNAATMSAAKAPTTTSSVAVEVTPTASNPFFSSSLSPAFVFSGQTRVDGAAAADEYRPAAEAPQHRDANPYTFGPTPATEEEEGESTEEAKPSTSTAAFVLTPWE